MDIKFLANSSLENLLTIMFEEDVKEGLFSQQINDTDLKLLQKQIKSIGFTGKERSSISVTSTIENKNLVLIIGGGKKSEASLASMLKLGGHICKLANASRIKDLSIDVSNLNKEQIENLALGLCLRNYNFNKYKTLEDKITNKIFLEKAELFAKTINNIDFTHGKAIIEGVHFARNLVSEPPNKLFPSSYSERCKDLAKLGINIEIFDEVKLEKLGFNALLGVAKGSSNPARLVVMHYKGGKENDPPVAFVGKGVTFDTGGISLKPAAGMEDMKYDMAGSAAVVGTMIALAGRKAKVNAVGVIGLVENMPDGNAQRPSDVVKSLSGQTIEVLNTDAEGRLVLADALWYTKETFKPKFMIDLATLTGAIVISLGSTYAGLFSNDDDLANKLYQTGLDTDEKLWRLPFHKDYDEDIDSEIADVRNTQKTARAAGSITAAEFLKRFVGGTPWAHLDIAGVAWDSKGCEYQPKGATGFGVRLLDKLVEKYFE